MSVLVVGAGPAGLVTAITLGRLGIRTVVVERRSTPSGLPRATGISLRSVELIRSWRLEPQLRAGEMDVGTTSWIGGPPASGNGMAASLGFPSPEHARRISPTTAIAAPQDHLEPVLLDHLRTLPSVEIRFATELLGLKQDEGGVSAVLKSEAGLSSERFRFVVGADGAHSAVRSAVGIAMEGSHDLAAYYTVTFRAPLAQRLPSPRHALYMVAHPEAGGVLLPTDNRDRWVFAQPYDPVTVRPLEYPRARLVELIRAASGVLDLPVTIGRVGTFTFAAQVAARYREGGVFLIGDAAHRITPRGATGMNTAIHDGHALAWRLAWVLRGWADACVLDGYEAERRPIGIRNTARSAEAGPRDNSLDYLDDLAGRIPHAWVEPSTSTLDLVGPGLTLLTGPSGLAWSEAVAELDPLIPVTVHGVDAAAAESLGIGHAGAILVRPDAIPVAAWPALDPARLGDAIRSATAPECVPVA
jgi:putative polyketide hydroxylase